MKKKIDIQRNSLLCVKSIMTIALTVMLCVMVYRQPETYSETFRNCIIMVVTFYFAHQTEKGGNSNEDTDQGKAKGTLPEGKWRNSALGEEDQEEKEEKEGEEK